MADFRQLVLGAPDISYGGTSISSFTMDQQTDQMEVICQVPADSAATTTITRLGYRLTTLTGVSPTFKMSIQGVDLTTGNPDGTIKGGGSPASKSFTVSGSNAWTWLTLDNSYVAARGEFIAIVISWVSGTIDGSNNVTFGQFPTNGPVQSIPFSIGNNAGVRTRSGIQPIFGFSSATRVFGFPLQLLRSTSYSSNSTPDEYGMAFTLSNQWFNSYQVIGARIMGQSGVAAKSSKMILYDGTTVLQDVTWDTDVASAASTVRPYKLYFDEATLSTLAAGKEYILAIQPQDTGISMQITGLECSAAGDLDAFGGGQSWYSVTRTDLGAWTVVNNVRPLVELIVQDVAGRSPGIIAATA